MFYENKIKRFILRKDFFKRFKRRIKSLNRRINKNVFDDLGYLFSLVNRQPKVIFDCGANIGFVTHKLMTKFSKASIHAFEPNPTIYEKLNSHYKNSERIHCHNIGIADNNGEMLFNINRNSGTSSFLYPNEYHTSNMASKHISPTVVTISTISSIMLREKIRHIDILKLDIEGFEIKAMDGIEKISENVSLIFIEVNLIPTYKNQPLINDIINYLLKKEFHIYNFYGINENINRQANITNLLFMSSKFKTELISNGYQKSFSY